MTRSGPSELLLRQNRPPPPGVFQYIRPITRRELRRGTSGAQGTATMASDTVPPSRCTKLMLSLENDKRFLQHIRAGLVASKQTIQQACLAYEDSLARLRARESI